MKRGIFLFALFIALVCSALADEGNHHEDLTSDQLGTVHFPTSCVPSVQKNFERGVALLHSFWYEEASKEFQEIAKSDPHCAMAHWGIAMSSWHQLWDHPNAATLRAGVEEVQKAESLHAKTPRERDYIAAIGAFYKGSDKADYQTRASAYSEGMEKVYQSYPDDKEGATFYALSLLASEPDNDTTFVNRKKAAAVLEPLFASEPNHPGVAHYLIHTYDKPQLAQLGVPAALRYAKVAPASPHALHMPSHIFARLGMWQDDINSNLASIAATRKTAAMHMGGEGHQFHAMDFLVYAYLQCGREADAQKVIEEVKAMPATQDMYGMGYDPRAASLTLFSARYALEMHHWAEAAALPLLPNATAGDTSITYYARAIGAARTGNAGDASKALNEIEIIHKKLLDAKKTEFADAVEKDAKVAQAWLDFAEGRRNQAIAAMSEIASKEEAEGERDDVGIPAREMLADMHMEMNHSDQALTDYETDLKFNPNRFNGLYGAAHAAEMAGKSQDANSYYAKLVQVCAGSNSDRPELARAKQLLAQK